MSPIINPPPADKPQIIRDALGLIRAASNHDLDGPDKILRDLGTTAIGRSIVETNKFHARIDSVNDLIRLGSGAVTIAAFFAHLYAEAHPNSSDPDWPWTLVFEMADRLGDDSSG
jgi:hypothetical protein